jgi:DNA-binding CsgD family transcriptional regulator
MKTLVNFEDYLEKARAVKTTSELFDVFIKTISQYGYDRALFALLTNHQEINQSAGIGVMQNYPEGWMRHYHEQELHRIDPILTYGAHQTEAFKWDDIPKKVQLLKKQVQCLALGTEAGLNNGISIPLRGLNHQMAGISLATSEKKDACHPDTDLITAYCNHFYMAYGRLLRKTADHSRPVNIVLTERERDILSQAALGKSDNEIASILCLSRHTVNSHFRKIYEKIGLNNRILVVVTAIRTGLI